VGRASWQAFKGYLKDNKRQWGGGPPVGAMGETIHGEGTVADEVQGGSLKNRDPREQRGRI